MSPWRLWIPLHGPNPLGRELVPPAPWPWFPPSSVFQEKEPFRVPSLLRSSQVSFCGTRTNRRHFPLSSIRSMKSKHPKETCWRRRACPSHPSYWEWLRTPQLWASLKRPWLGRSPGAMSSDCTEIRSLRERVPGWVHAKNYPTWKLPASQDLPTPSYPTELSSFSVPKADETALPAPVSPGTSDPRGAAHLNAGQTALLPASECTKNRSLRVPDSGRSKAAFSLAPRSPPVSCRPRGLECPFQEEETHVT